MTVSKLAERYYALQHTHKELKDAVVITQTDKAILVKLSFADGVWIPKSQVEVFTRPDKSAIYFVTNWFYEKTFA